MSIRISLTLIWTQHLRFLFLQHLNVYYVLLNVKILEDFKQREQILIIKLNSCLVSNNNHLTRSLGNDTARASTRRGPDITIQFIQLLMSRNYAEILISIIINKNLRNFRTTSIILYKNWMYLYLGLKRKRELYNNLHCLCIKYLSS